MSWVRRRHAFDGVSVSPELGELGEQAGTWDSLGYIHGRLGNQAQAITCYQHAIALFRDRGDLYAEADSLTNLGDTHHTTGNHEAAGAAWQQALTILEDLQHADADMLRARIDEVTPLARHTEA